MKIAKANRKKTLTLEIPINSYQTKLLKIYHHLDLDSEVQMQIKVIEIQYKAKQETLLHKTMQLQMKIK